MNTEPKCCNYWSPHTLEPMLCNEKPAKEEQPLLPQLEKACMQQRRPSTTTAAATESESLPFATTWMDLEDIMSAAAAAAESLQLCLTLCNPIDGSPPGSPGPGILQARTLEWVAISFSHIMPSEMLSEISQRKTNTV